MRGLFMIVSLLVTLAIVGVLAKKQLASMPGGATSSIGGTSTSTPTSTSPSPSSAPKETVQQFKQALEAAQPVKRDADEK